MKIMSGSLLAGVLALAATLGPAAAQPFQMRASVDTNMTTSRTAHLAEYLAEVEKRSNGRIKPVLYHSAQLYPDRDVGKALLQGSVEMALPGSWTISGIVPDLDFPGLPSFFGISTANARKVVDGLTAQVQASGGLVAHAEHRLMALDHAVAEFGTVVAQVLLSLS